MELFELERFELELLMYILCVKSSLKNIPTLTLLELVTRRVVASSLTLSSLIASFKTVSTLFFKSAFIAGLLNFPGIP